MVLEKAEAQFKFKLNNSIYYTDKECPTGAEILNIAGYDNPNDYDLILVRKGKDEFISLDQTVCLSDPGVERFRARPKKVKDGYKGSESSLPLKDIEYLNENFPNSWEFKKDNRLNILLIKDFLLPEGYNVSKADMIIIIPDRYDSVPLDMAFFKQNLSRKDGKSIARLTPRTFLGETYQQWSRHRTNDNPWTIGLDSIQTHIDLINFFLRKEVEK
ncbi:multiubiquitin domain-containing protein [Aestuariibaculum sp. M13]|uniref:multiubiquitin domain-containing protein n=1 Tax=Aestuariibaculum sp. M13 TaxID=2967132 RepID=UPI002159E84D|nr:multiubiquitin domain-containing protein [Aestuariibaculum sp. M13]MCR8667295.1 multiubiquitin domain-containing protein [Aestuariibaculum sp. M13]